MLTRTMNTTVVGRSSAMRRQRRRAVGARLPYCATNGCASFLEMDAAGRTARCPVCGYVRRLD